eukprot:augustus_masked-scaffold_27-processed-gene-4.65-mRNA-1 protein AED:1.00 eAED:1.00 QI:0/-1/0/0/-1/1/1/0/88
MKTIRGHKSIQTVVDNFSELVWSLPLSLKLALELVEVLKNEWPLIFSYSQHINVGEAYRIRLIIRHAEENGRNLTYSCICARCQSRRA